MKILVINSDSPNNRGDRAILLGIIKLLKMVFPGAEIWAISEYAQRDQQWFGINFLPMRVQSLSLFDLLCLLRKAKTCDMIFWGGGELLKDYTNKFGLFYWVLKLFMVSLINKNIFGMFQGVGPTESGMCRWLIRKTVDRTKIFFVRDKESRDKLLAWGARTKIVSSFDPAILETPGFSMDQIKEFLRVNYGIDGSITANFIGIGPRNWFHYQKGKWVPFKYLQMLPWYKKQGISESSIRFYKNLAHICDFLIKHFDTHIIFFPMHMATSEGDIWVSHKVIDYMVHKEKVFVIDQDNMSPRDYLNTISMAKLFFGIRLHSTILAVASGVPSVVLYYVDKGRVFFDQIEQSRYAMPIENILDEKNLPRIEEKFKDISMHSSEVRNTIKTRLESMRKELINVFGREFPL